MDGRSFATVTDTPLEPSLYLTHSQAEATPINHSEIPSNAFHCGNFPHCSERNYNIMCMRLYYNIMYM